MKMLVKHVFLSGVVWAYDADPRPNGSVTVTATGRHIESVSFDVPLDLAPQVGEWITVGYKDGDYSDVTMKLKVRVNKTGTAAAA